MAEKNNRNYRYISLCPAKVNLFLKVLGKKNKYHQLQTLISFIDLNDVLEVGFSANFKLEIFGEFQEFIDKENNLFTEILNYFSKQFQISKNLHIKIYKNIPIGAGLGGGSSNAAEFMKILNEVFQLNLSKEKLQEISLNFGSDIAFFFEDKSSLISGRGEKIENFNEFENFDILFINPKEFTSTKEVFENFGNNYSQEIANHILQNLTIDDSLKLGNDLTNIAIKFTPEISEILQELSKNKAKNSLMSGSGSSCFAVFENEESLKKALKKISQKFPNYLVKKLTAKFHR
jgi:4-diphosphocytidyl-2-C-methyl-D-erythritol kinase